jgi:predicted transcriptional regulator
MRPSDRTLLVSLRPRFASLLLSGRKTVELRRTPPDVACGALVLIYESSPERRLVGFGHVGAIDVGEPRGIWTRHGPDTGITRAEFDAYFEGTSRAVAITLRDTARLDRPASLEELRHRWSEFRPPQSFRYLTPAQVQRLTGHRPEPKTPKGWPLATAD